MLKALSARLFQGYRTNKFPAVPPNLPDRFRGRPVIPEEAAIDSSCCPSGALQSDSIDLGKCIFCGNCTKCGVKFTGEYRLGAFSREALIVKRGEALPSVEERPKSDIAKLCSKSLKIREVSAGGCSACELDFNVLGTLAWDMGRLGLQIVARPRHADCLLVTGPVSKNMLTALKKTYNAMSEPRFVIANGACAISGGLFGSSDEVCAPLDEIIPVDFYVPGCPPHPATLLEALQRFKGGKAGAISPLEEDKQ
ncbi:MAG: NADH-quinone oxidoreductase subunit NuoB [Lentisphaeria bacterium]|nr:NADH-quinone oxidoreductase subunit NuoB [Lentisphaeria bacterium]